MLKLVKEKYNDAGFLNIIKINEKKFKVKNIEKYTIT